MSSVSSSTTSSSPAPSESPLARFGATPSERVLAAVRELQAGRAVILVDDEDRENEGDLVFAAEKTTPELINFMAREGRGLICLTLTEERLRALDISMMVKQNSSSYGTAFTVSIEARTGVTTGISAHDRARTIHVAIDETSRPDDLLRPGHIFPLRAQPGGVLVRTGQTEGSLDLARIAGLKPAGVICEILNDDGTMSRLPELLTFAEKHNLMILAVADIIAYRLQTESLIVRQAEATVETAYGPLQAIAFRSTVDEQEAIAFVKGNINQDAGHSNHHDDKAPLVRVHSGDALTDIFGGILDEGGLLLHASVQQVAQAESGVVLYLPRPAAPMRFVEALHAVEHARKEGGALPARERAPSGQSPVVRHYGMGAQILRQLGVRRMRLLTNNPARMSALRGFGIEIASYEPINIDAAALKLTGK